MKLQLTSTKNVTAVIVDVEIAWGYITTYRGETYVRYISKENSMNGSYQFEEMKIENDMMVHILP